MPTTFVAVDLETTGLDPARDAIIEVAAVTFQGHDVLREYVSFVDPERAIPPEITRLTGITEAMIAGAPDIFSLRSRLKAELADHVIVGHNVDFDLGFLRQAHLAARNHRLDTLMLASILVPEAGRYGLESLARHLNFPVSADGQHRALNDAIQTVELFLALRERALALELCQLEEIIQAGRSLGWPETLFFEEALAERAKHAFAGNELRQRGRLPRLFNVPAPEGQAPQAAEKLRPLDVLALGELLEPDGHFSRLFEGFEYRPQQVEMLQAVAQAFNDGQQILVEAGTGTGKSIGYLLPAAFWATQNGRRVVISTNTINLQDQLIGKDIPTLQRLLGIDLRAAIRKGRSNYICTRLFNQLRRTGPNSADEMALYARILLWLPKSHTGDVAELTVRTPGERMAWSKINGENPVCTSEQCAAEHCPVYIARRRAELAHLIIVNHALLLADVSTGGMVLPDYRDLIIDEAHHLESAVTSGLSFRADRRFFDTILQDAIRPRAGIVGNAQQRVGAAAPGNASEKFDSLAERARIDAQDADRLLEDFFMTLDYFLRDIEAGSSQFAQQIRLTPAIRVQPDYHLVEASWSTLSAPLLAVSRGYEKLAELVDDVARDADLEGEDELRAALLSHSAKLAEAVDYLEQIISDPDDGAIYWVERYRDTLSLHAAPLHVGPLVFEHIFSAKETVVLTSATMRTAGLNGVDASFDYLRERLQAQHTDELAVGSPFDYKNSTLLYLVTDISEPNQPGYQMAVEQAIIDVVRTLGGRTLVLFTANSQLAQTAQAIEGPLATYGITVLAQGSGLSRQQLLDQFRAEDSRSVLLGTRSFWEGVDIPGDALQALLITRLPFDVPSDPVFAARSETYENSFFQYSVPEAVLRFRQGFGRLIRRTSDEGIVVVLDKRLLTKRYGEFFLEALPECTVVRQRSDRLGELIGRWLAPERNRQR